MEIVEVIVHLGLLYRIRVDCLLNLLVDEGQVGIGYLGEGFGVGVGMRAQRFGDDGLDLVGDPLIELIKLDHEVVLSLSGAHCLQVHGCLHQSGNELQLVLQVFRSVFFLFEFFFEVLRDQLDITIFFVI